ncbi:MAG: hypothetical protein Q7R30_03055 [Acidobacteriota bacterium]|nr:hypothetical protein [Acidobacteriota bacterium]
MASVASAAERRRDHRIEPADTSWRPDAVLRPGQSVRLLNICRCGALVESSARLRPGARTELQLAGLSARHAIRGRLERCHVATLDPLRYRGVIVFDESVDLGEARGVSE